MVAMIAVIVVGPKELPGMLRAFGKAFGQVRRTAREFQSTFNEALRDAEREARLDDVRKSLDDVRHMDPAKDLSKSLDETRKAMRESVSERPKEGPPSEQRTSGNDKGDVVPLKPVSGAQNADDTPSDERKVAGADR